MGVSKGELSDFGEDIVERKCVRYRKLSFERGRASTTSPSARYGGRASMEARLAHMDEQLKSMGRPTRDSPASLDDAALEDMERKCIRIKGRGFRAVLEDALAFSAFLGEAGTDASTRSPSPRHGCSNSGASTSSSAITPTPVAPRTWTR